MKIVLLAINAKYVHSSLSVWVIAGGVANYSRLLHEVSVIETTINQQNEDIADSVASHKPDVLGVSTYIWNAGKLPALLNLLRERLPDTIFALGGPEASNNAKFWIDCGADHVLPGEGEYIFPVFVDELAEGKLVDKVYQQEKERINKPVDPYTDSLFKALDGRIAYLETSRGCPFRCSFCLSAGSGVRFFPLDAAKEQIHKLSQSGTHTVKFVDRTFNCNAERAYELFAQIIKLDTTCRFHFEVAADLFDDRTMSLLATAPLGRIQLEIGLQSFYEPALKASQRQIDFEKAEKNILTLLQARNIHIHVDLIAGLPYETLDDFIRGFDRAYALDAHTLQLGFLKLLHGSVLREQAEVFGISYGGQPPYEIKSSPWLSEEDIKTLKQTENALQHTYNKGRFLSTLKYVLAASGLSPFWFLNALGAAAPNHGTQLEKYIEQIYSFCVELSGVDSSELCDCLIYDWLSMVKGKNTPTFLKNQDVRRENVEKKAEAILGRKPGRSEVAVLHSGKGVFVDSSDRDQVSGLYRTHFMELEEL